MNTTHSSSPVLVIGGGAMGTAAAFHLARRGEKVVLFEQYQIGHDLGSSHGYSRIIRRAYYEHPDYVPLVDRAYELWRELEVLSGESLLTTTGILEMGAPCGPLLKGSALSCQTHGIPHELLDASQIRARFPQFSVPDWMSGIWQKDAGILAVERCVLTHRQEAKKLGCEFREQEEVIALEETSGGVRLRTRKGEFEGKRALVCAGPWAGKLLADLGLPLVVTRQAMGFYAPLECAPFELGRFPLFLLELPGHNYYGFPFFGIDCVKVARHHGGRIVTPETVDRAFNAEGDRLLRDFLEAYIPRASGPLRHGKVCLYTSTPDHDFILDQHPTRPNVVLAAGFSGHGFKFASAIGEVLADLVLDGKTRHRIERFRLGRFRVNAV